MEQELKEINDRLALIIVNQKILEEKLNFLVENGKEANKRSNVGMFLQGIFLSDLLSGGISQNK